MSKKVVVTGAGGFVGRHLVSALKALGADVVAVTRRPSADFHVVSSYRETPGSDVLIHLAEHSVRAAAQEAGGDYQREAVQTLALLCRRFGRVVYASSGALYGDRHLRPCRPDDALLVNDVYTQVKASCEQEVLARGNVVARLSNLYGPGMSCRNVVSTILAQVPGDGAVEVLDEAPVRDFLWIKDAAEALAAMALGVQTGVYNVASGEGTSIRSLALLTLDLANQSGRPVIGRQPATVPPSHLVLDPSETISDFGWRPHTSLSAGLRTLLAPLNTQISRKYP